MVRLVSARKHSAWLLAIALLCLSSVARAGECPEGTIKIGEQRTETATAIVIQPRCQRVPVAAPAATNIPAASENQQQMVAAPQPSMRAKTRAECVRDAGIQLKQDLDACHGPVMSCLTKDGVPDQAAACVYSALGAAVTAAVTEVPGARRAASAGAGLALAGALHSCGVNARDVAQACSATAGTCQEGPLRAHQAAVAACRAN